MCPTCIQHFDDGRGLFNVQGDVVKPVILHQECEYIKTVVQGTLGLRFEPTGLIRVVLGSEPVSRVGGSTQKWGGNDGGWDERDAKVREQSILHIYVASVGLKIAL